jgi:hypothetical protein
MPKIITGHTGTPHITSDDVGALLKAIIGSNDYLLSDDTSTFVATQLDNNVVQMPDAEVVLQGTHIRVQQTDTVTVAQGQNGMKRFDLIVCRYTKTQEGIEGAEIDIVTGTPAASDPAVPAVTQGDIRGGALLHEMPLFKVELDGFSIVSVLRVVNTINSLKASFAAISATILGVEESMARSIKSVEDTQREFEYTVNTNIVKINANSLLWSGGFYMTANHSITIPPVQNQTNGIVLVFSVYSSGAAQDHNFHSFFIPKGAVTKLGNKGWNFHLFEGLFSKAATKYIYISNTKISGNDNNNKSGTGACGIKYENSRFVLRYVFGV